MVCKMCGDNPIKPTDFLKRAQILPHLFNNNSHHRNDPPDDVDYAEISADDLVFANSGIVRRFSGAEEYGYVFRDNWLSILRLYDTYNDLYLRFQSAMNRHLKELLSYERQLRQRYDNLSLLDFDFDLDSSFPLSSSATSGFSPTKLIQSSTSSLSNLQVSHSGIYEEISKSESTLKWEIYLNVIRPMKSLERSIKYHLTTISDLVSEFLDTTSTSTSTTADLSTFDQNRPNFDLSLMDTSPDRALYLITHVYPILQTVHRHMEFLKKEALDTSSSIEHETVGIDEEKNNNNCEGGNNNKGFPEQPPRKKYQIPSVYSQVLNSSSSSFSTLSLSSTDFGSLDSDSSDNSTCSLATVQLIEQVQKHLNTLQRVTEEEQQQQPEESESENIDEVKDETQEIVKSAHSENEYHYEDDFEEPISSDSKETSVSLCSNHKNNDNDSEYGQGELVKEISVEELSSLESSCVSLKPGEEAVEELPLTFTEFLHNNDNDNNDQLINKIPESDPACEDQLEIQEIFVSTRVQEILSDNDNDVDGDEDLESESDEWEETQNLSDQIDWLNKFFK